MIYANLYPQSLAALDGQLRTIHAKGRLPLVTIEPWPLTYQGYEESALLDDIVAGRYDQQLRQVGASMNLVHGPVLVRPMHEMDIAELYAWSGQSPTRYIEAYRHIYNILQEQSAGNLVWIWSPAGNVNALHYYPGDGYVDYVGFTGLSSQAFNLNGTVGSPQSFTSVVVERYGRLYELGKPMLITEAGIQGAPSERATWLSEMFTTLDRYPLLRGLVYYNDLNAINKLVPVPPDYSITQQQWDEAQR
jgi:beta-mannanase